MRIDITSLNTADNSRTVIDSAAIVKFSPRCVQQLLVTTSANKLLKFDSRTGRILAEVHLIVCNWLSINAFVRTAQIVFNLMVHSRVSSTLALCSVLIFV